MNDIELECNVIEEAANTLYPLHMPRTINNDLTHSLDVMKSIAKQIFDDMPIEPRRLTSRKELHDYLNQLKIETSIALCNRINRGRSCYCDAAAQELVCLYFGVVFAAIQCFMDKSSDEQLPCEEKFYKILEFVERLIKPKKAEEAEASDEIGLISISAFLKWEESHNNPYSGIKFPDDIKNKFNEIIKNRVGNEGVDLKDMSTTDYMDFIYYLRLKFTTKIKEGTTAEKLLDLIKQESTKTLPPITLYKFPKSMRESYIEQGIND